MDKMGSSSRSGNKGQPATPRDGAAVELQGLALYVAEGLGRLAEQGHFPYKEMSKSGKILVVFNFLSAKNKKSTKVFFKNHILLFLDTVWTWKQWAEKIRKNFPENFYVDFDAKHKSIHRRGILKDCHESSDVYTDFQLRPNFCIALNAVIFFVFLCSKFSFFRYRILWIRKKHIHH